MPTLLYGTYFLVHWNAGNERKIKNIILNGYSEYYNQFGTYQTFSYNLSNPEAYSELCETWSALQR